MAGCSHALQRHLSETLNSPQRSRRNLSNTGWGSIRPTRSSCISTEQVFRTLSSEREPNDVHTTITALYRHPYAWVDSVSLLEELAPSTPRRLSLAPTFLLPACRSFMWECRFRQHLHTLWTRVCRDTHTTIHRWYII